MLERALCAIATCAASIIPTSLVEVNPVREERSPIEDACVREPRCDA